MGTTDIVIHKGEKDAKYQLYVEDYVISYLKNYGAEDNGRIFFYGKREQQSKKYRIYGAGAQAQISCFAEYDLLEEITCRITMDMPVFYRRESSGTYEISGFYIFYQSNEAMQSYMIDRRKEAREQEKAQNAGKAQSTPRHQGLPEIHRKPAPEMKPAPKEKNGLLAVQLTAIFVVLIAIVINSTNSFDKLEELNQAAVEVFFAIENQEANAVHPMQEGKEEAEAGSESVKTDVQTEGTVLKLEDLDTKFEEENQIAKQEEEENNTQDSNVSTMEESNTEADGASEKETDNTGEAESGIDETKQDDNPAGEKGTQESADNTGENDTADEQDIVALDESAPSQQAFARNFAEYYQIEKGDTLYTISIKIYGDTSKVNEICELNQIVDPDNIKYGQKILLP